MMGELLQGPGFLGTSAPFISDLSLSVMLLTAALFSVGRQLARTGHFAAHRWLQTGSVALNAAAAVVVMTGSFITHILPGIPSKLLEGDYGISTLHAFVGTTALLLGIFVVLRGNNLVPHWMRFSDYRPVMRTTYALYMLATLSGVIVYALVFVLGI